MQSDVTIKTASTELITTSAIGFDRRKSTTILFDSFCCFRFDSSGPPALVLLFTSTTSLVFSVLFLYWCCCVVWPVTVVVFSLVAVAVGSCCCCSVDLIVTFEWSLLVCVVLTTSMIAWPLLPLYVFCVLLLRIDSFVWLIVVLLFCDGCESSEVGIGIALCSHLNEFASLDRRWSLWLLVYFSKFGTENSVAIVGVCGWYCRLRRSIGSPFSILWRPLPEESTRSLCKISNKTKWQRIRKIKRNEIEFEKVIKNGKLAHDRI